MGPVIAYNSKTSPYTMFTYTFYTVKLRKNVHTTKSWDNFLATLTFRGPCIVIYSYNKSQQDALFLGFIWFGQVHCPSSGVSQQCIHAIGICHANSVGCLLAWSFWPHYQTANRTSMTNTYCTYTVLRYSWRWTVDLSETCTVLYQINLRNCASCWLSL
jgi:hypothetical protein